MVIPPAQRGAERSRPLRADAERNRERIVTAAGCHVTGLTLSPAQLAYATDRLAAAGLADRAALHLRDYRDQDGTFDAIVEVVCEDDAELLELLNTEIRAVPGVTATETLVYLKLVKQQYNWGTR